VAGGGVEVVVLGSVCGCGLVGGGVVVVTSGLCCGVGV